MTPSTNLKVFQLSQVIRFWNVSSELPLSTLNEDAQWHFFKGCVLIISKNKMMLLMSSVCNCYRCVPDPMKEYYGL